MPMMVLENRPECFRHFVEPFVWIQGYDEHGPYAHLAIAYIHETAVVHIDINRWTPNILKLMKEEWQEIVDMCREKGMVYIVAQTDKLDDPKWPRLVGYFGFPEPTKLALSVMTL